MREREREYRGLERDREKSVPESENRRNRPTGTHRDSARHTHATRTYTCFPRSIHPISLSGLICTGTELLTTEVLYSTQYTEYHSTTLQLADVRLHRYLRSGGRRNLEGISHGTST